MQSAIPVTCVNGTTNGCRQSAHAWAPLLVSVWRNAVHPVVSAPPAHAACASVRSCAVHALDWTVGEWVIVPCGQPE